MENQVETVAETAVEVVSEQALNLKRVLPIAAPIVGLVAVLAFFGLKAWKRNKAKKVVEPEPVIEPQPEPKE